MHTLIQLKLGTQNKGQLKHIFEPILMEIYYKFFSQKSQRSVTPSG